MAAVAMDVPRAFSSPDEMRAFLADKTVEAVKRIAEDHFKRQELADPSHLHFSREAALDALRGGVWYSTDYIAAFRKLNKHLKEINQPLKPADLAGLAPLSNLKYVSKGNAPSAYFAPTGNVLVWRAKPDVSASDALDAALAGPTLTDCGGACNLARHKALRDLLGKERYDKIFRGRLFIGYPRVDYLDLFTKTSTQNAKGKYEMRRGNKVLFKNNELYVLKHPFGICQAYHMVYAGQGQYVSIGVPPGGYTIPQTVALLRDDFNKPINRRLDGMICDDEMALLLSGQSEECLLSKDVQIATEQVPGLALDKTEEFDLARIESVLKFQPDDLTDAALRKLFPELAQMIEIADSKEHS